VLRGPFGIFFRRALGVGSFSPSFSLLLPSCSRRMRRCSQLVFQHRSQFFSFSLSPVGYRSWTSSLRTGIWDLARLREGLECFFLFLPRKRWQRCVAFSLRNRSSAFPARPLPFPPSLPPPHFKWPFEQAKRGQAEEHSSPPLPCLHGLTPGGWCSPSPDYLRVKAIGGDPSVVSPFHGPSSSSRRRPPPLRPSFCWRAQRGRGLFSSRTGLNRGSHGRRPMKRAFGAFPTASDSTFFPSFFFSPSESSRSAFFSAARDFFRTWSPHPLRNG